MRRIIFGLAVLAGSESGAMACECDPPRPLEEARAAVRDAAQGIVAVVEAEAITEFRMQSGEQVRVYRTLYGEAPRTFRIERKPYATGTCEVLLKLGERRILILRRGESGAYRMQGPCTDYLTTDRYLPIMLEELRRSGGMSNKAGERAANCPPERRVSVAG